MFGRKQKPEVILIERAAIRLLDDMELFGPDSEEYAKCLQHYERITTLRNSKRSKLSPDGVLLVVGNLCGILIIVAYEQKHVLSSKGIGFVLKSK